MNARLLGPPALSWHGRNLEHRPQKGLALLYYLAAKPDGVAREELAELLWGFGKAKNLRQELYLIRRLPGAERWLNESGPLRLSVSSDLQALEEASAAGRYDTTLSLWRGPFLEGFDTRGMAAFSDWLTLERVRLEDILRQALRQQAHSHLESEPDEALTLLERLLELDPLDESTHRSLMRLYYQQGKREAALEQFAGCRRALAEELGLEPLEETLELAQRIRERQPLTVRHAPPAWAAPPAQLLRPPRLIGREAEWTQMEAAWRAGQTIFLSGEAGMGKSRLLLDFSQSKGSYLLTEGRHGDQGVPYSSAVRTFERALEQFPNLPSLPADDANRFMQAIWALMEQVRRRVSALPTDNLQYYDNASQKVAHVLTTRFAETKEPGAARMLSAFRPEELSPAERERIRKQCEHGHAALIELGPLDSDAIHELLVSLELPHHRNLVHRLQRYTGGNPMFLLATFRSLHSRGELRGNVMAQLRLPGKIANLISARLATLSTPTLRVARALAISQLPFDAELIAEMLEMTPFEVSEAAEELARNQLLASETFVNELIPETIRATTPEPVQRFLQRRAAEALTGRGADPARIATHWLEAGEGERAAPFLLRAGEAARKTYALAEARRRYFQALWASQDTTCRAQALMGLEGLAAHLNDGDLQHTALGALDTLARDMQDDELLFESQLRSAARATRDGDPHKGLKLAERAQHIARRLEREDFSARAALHLGGSAFYAGELAEAKRAFAQASRAEDPALKLRALNNLGAIAGTGDQLERAAEYQEEALTWARRLGDLSQVAGLLNNLGATLERMADYEQALRHFSEALEIHRRIQDAHGETISLTNLAEVEAKRGLFAAAREHANMALEQAQRLAKPSLMRRARLVLGLLERQLGAFESALQHFDEARNLAKRAGDRRGELVAELNFALCRLRAASTPVEDVLENLEALEAADLTHLLRWGYAELALFAPESLPDEHSAWLHRAREGTVNPRPANPHLEVLLHMAEQRAAPQQTPDAHAPLEAALEAISVAESPWGYELLAQAHEHAQPQKARALRQKAWELLEVQLEGLPRELEQTARAQLHA